MYTGNVGASHFASLINDYWYSKYCKLTELSLNRCEIGDEGAISLGKSVCNIECPSNFIPLRILGLSGNKIGNLGATHLARGILNSNITELDVSANLICNYGAFELSKLIKKNDKMRVLNVSWNIISWYTHSRHLVRY